jgi:SAM-dependent MidA family methyltransferase
VDLDDPGGALIERDGPPCPGVEELAALHGAASGEGSQAEVSTRADAMLARMAASLETGCLVIVDYGDLAPRLHARHPHGTALAYRDHATSPCLLDRPGEQDLTAHVNFSQLERHARHLGLRPLAFTTQERFLIGCGILEAFGPPPPGEWHDPRFVKRRLQALHLIHPGAMGRRFKVQVFWKGGDPAPRLPQLLDPLQGGARSRCT